MKIINKNNSIVLLAESHNPTLFSDSFLIETNIINKLDEINRNNTILTPVFVTIGFMDGSTLQLDPSRFTISSDNNEIIANRTISYIRALPHIKCSGIGINFDYNVTEYDFNSFFGQFNNCYDSNIGKIYSLDLKFAHDHGDCFVKISILSENAAVFNFNFDYQISLVPFKELSISLSLDKESEQNKEKSFNFINKILG